MSAARTVSNKGIGVAACSWSTDAIRAAASDAKVVKAVLRDLDRAGKEHKLAGFERVKSIRLFLEPFSIENGLLTPTCVFPPIRFVFSSYSLQPIQTSELTITATLIQVETQACSTVIRGGRRRCVIDAHNSKPCEGSCFYRTALCCRANLEMFRWRSHE